MVLRDLSPPRLYTGRSSWSFAYMHQAVMSCRELFRQTMPFAFDCALASAGKMSPARMAMTAMTVSSSTSVNAARGAGRFRYAEYAMDGMKNFSGPGPLCKGSAGAAPLSGSLAFPLNAVKGRRRTFFFDFCNLERGRPRPQDARIDRPEI